MLNVASAPTSATRDSMKIASQSTIMMPCAATGEMMFVATISERTIDVTMKDATMTDVTIGGVTIVAMTEEMIVATIDELEEIGASEVMKDATMMDDVVKAATRESHVVATMAIAIM